MITRENGIKRRKVYQTIVRFRKKERNTIQKAGDKMIERKSN